MATHDHVSTPPQTSPTLHNCRGPPKILFKKKIKFLTKKRLKLLKKWIKFPQSGMFVINLHIFTACKNFQRFWPGTQPLPYPAKTVRLSRCALRALRATLARPWRAPAGPGGPRSVSGVPRRAINPGPRRSAALGGALTFLSSGRTRPARPPTNRTGRLASREKEKEKAKPRLQKRRETRIGWWLGHANGRAGRC